MANVYLEKIAKARIKIKHSHAGMLHQALGIAEGKKISAKKEEKAKHSSNPKLRRQATFALNAKKWHKKD